MKEFILGIITGGRIFIEKSKELSVAIAKAELAEELFNNTRERLAVKEEFVNDSIDDLLTITSAFKQGETYSYDQIMQVWHDFFEDQAVKEEINEMELGQ